MSRSSCRVLLLALAVGSPRLLAQTPPQPVPTPTPEPTPTPSPAPAAPVGSSKVFNPDIAVVGDFLGAMGRNRTENAPPALELHEAELSLQAVVDAYARADFFFAYSPEGAEVEEGFITFTSLPGKLLLKAGKLRAGFGKVNTLHTHILPWTDRPLVTQNLLGGDEGIADAGLSLARLLPIGSTFLEATAEVYRGESEGVFQAPRRRDLLYVGRLRGYRDITESANFELGSSLAYGHNGVAADTTTRLFGVDATFRYRPLRRAIYRRLLARSELVWSRAELERAAFNSFGAYLSTEYQFARRWFAGVRFDVSGRAFEDVPNDKGGSLLLTFWPSEFSQVRGQYRYARLGTGEKNNEFLFQLLFSIGAHGAHPF
jgi:hypothetical protein